MKGFYLVLYWLSNDLGKTFRIKVNTKKYKKYKISKITFDFKKRGTANKEQPMQLERPEREESQYISPQKIIIYNLSHSPSTEREPVNVFQIWSTMQFFAHDVITSAILVFQTSLFVM